jgi:hypothetical protein
VHPIRFTLVPAVTIKFERTKHYRAKRMAYARHLEGIFASSGPESRRGHGRRLPANIGPLHTKRQ